MKKVTWLALIVIGGFYPVFWTYFVFGPMRFLAESIEPPYEVTVGGIAFLAVFWAAPIVGAVAFIWHVLRDARKVAQGKLIENVPSEDEEGQCSRRKMNRKKNSFSFGLLLLSVVSIASGYWAWEIASELGSHYRNWGIRWSLFIRGGCLVAFFSILAISAGWPPCNALWKRLRARITHSRDS